MGEALAQRASGTPPAAVAVRDVAALAADHPRGAGLAAGSLPLVIGGILAAALLTSRSCGTGRRVVGALGFAVTGGLAMAAILQFWLGSLADSYRTNSGVVAPVGRGYLGDPARPGVAARRRRSGPGGAVMVVLGNPRSGMTSALEMLPGWSGTLGQLLPVCPRRPLRRSSRSGRRYRTATRLRGRGLRCRPSTVRLPRGRSPGPASLIEPS